MGGCVSNAPKIPERLTEDDQRLKKYYPLHFACQYNDADRVQRLLQQRKTEINILDHRGYTPLIVAISSENWFVVSMLAQETRCDFSLADKEGNAPIHHVVLKAPVDIIKTVCKKSHVDLVNKKRETALARAARAKNLDAIKALLEMGADVNGSHRFRRGLPLMNAIKKSWVEGARFFLQHEDIDLNAKPGPRGEGFLWCRHSEILELLLETDINVSLADDQGVLADEWLDAQHLSENASKIRDKRKQERKESIARRRPEVGGRRLPPDNVTYSEYNHFTNDQKSSRFNRQIRTTADSTRYFDDPNFLSASTRGVDRKILRRDISHSGKTSSGYAMSNGAGASAAVSEASKRDHMRAAHSTAPIFPSTPDTTYSKNFTPDTATPSDNPLYANHPLYQTLVPQPTESPTVTSTQELDLVSSYRSTFDDIIPDYDEPDYDRGGQKRRLQYRAHDFTSPIV